MDISPNADAPQKRPGSVQKLRTVPWHRGTEEKAQELRTNEQHQELSLEANIGFNAGVADQGDQKDGAT